jgi:putative membrane protein
MRDTLGRRPVATTAAFLGGGLVFAIAMLSPLHHLAATRFWLHMVQLELLMLVAAPLLVIGNPFGATRGRVSRALSARTRYAAPIVSSVLYAIALWIWHVPILYDAAVASPGLQVAQHASLFLAAVLFWGAVLRPAPGGIDVLCIVVTMIHMGLLGALLTFAGRPLYAGFTLEDQQLGGLIMWVPAGSLVLLKGLWVFDRWLESQS